MAEKRNNENSMVVSEMRIDAITVWRVMLENWRMIVALPLIFAAITAGLTLLLPNLYRAEVLMVPVTLENENMGGLGGFGGFGDLAALTGINVTGGGNKSENLAVLKSREFIWTFIYDQNLMSVLFDNEWDAKRQDWLESDSENQPTLWDAYRLIDREILSITDDRQTGLVRVAIVWRDADLVADWANQMVSRLNDYLRKRAIERSEANLAYLYNELGTVQVVEMRETLYHLIAKEQRTAMLANTQKEFAFRILDPAAIPDKKYKPNRALIVVFLGFLTGILTIAYVFIRKVLLADENQVRT